MALGSNGVALNWHIFGVFETPRSATTVRRMMDVEHLILLSALENRRHPCSSPQVPSCGG